MTAALLDALRFARAGIATCARAPGEAAAFALLMLAILGFLTIGGN